MTWRIAAVLTLFVSASAFAEDAAQKRAREELERELKQIVGTPPTRVRVEFVSPDEPNYKLEEASFEIDGKPVPVQSLAAMAADGTHTVFLGDVAPGKHKVSARLVFANGTSSVLSDEGGYKWKLGGDATFEVTPGLEVQVQVVPARDSSQKDISKRFTLRMPAAPVMVAKLDDGKMPEPPTAAKVKPAGEKVAAIAPTNEAAKPVAEAKTFDGPPRPSAERGRPAQGIAVAEPDQPAPIAGAEVDAGEVDVASVAVAEVFVVDAGAPEVALIVPEPEGPDGLLWLLGGGALVVAILLFAVARRRSRVPTVPS